MTTTTEELAAWIADMESQPHLSLKEERYLVMMKELLEYRRILHKQLGIK